MNIIVFYQGGYMDAKSELKDLLRKMGDDKANVEILVPGVVGVETELNPRRFTEELRDMQAGDPESVRCIAKAVPIDDWCAVEEVGKVVKEDFKSVIADALYRVDVQVHRGDANADEITKVVQEVINGRIDVDHPQKIIRVDVFDKQASVSLLKELDIFRK